MSDLEAPPNVFRITNNTSETSPLLPLSESTTQHTRDTSACSSTQHSRDSSVASALDDYKHELEQPWPATFDRGIQILAGPIMNERSIDGITKSPCVSARYYKKVSFEYSLHPYLKSEMYHETDSL